ncbi:hypothetical protein JDV02_005267 [Purpureocillium takamizusanense]|uniref:Uncharacterized protein n=1 Tax=Purpureocillium takamizusanense TaxID=2060973 RepID=A0A9Q8QGY0_9HYPO|nr:uncharacterized protein JDV02_005267 [Purpureocillium takamizusanense]UNI19047.1 hypothetical protein JDV02_005267 [Purpureocillium takamizusanense]
MYALLEAQYPRPCQATPPVNITTSPRRALVRVNLMTLIFPSEDKISGLPEKGCALEAGGCKAPACSLPSLHLDFVRNLSLSYHFSLVRASQHRRLFTFTFIIVVIGIGIVITIIIIILTSLSILFFFFLLTATCSLVRSPFSVMSSVMDDRFGFLSVWVGPRTRVKKEYVEDEAMYLEGMTVLLDYINTGNTCDDMVRVIRAARAWCREYFINEDSAPSELPDDIAFLHPNFLNLSIASWHRLIGPVDFESYHDLFPEADFVDPFARDDMEPSQQPAVENSTQETEIKRTSDGLIVLDERYAWDDEEEDDEGESDELFEMTSPEEMEVEEASDEEMEVHEGYTWDTLQPGPPAVQNLAGEMDHNGDELTSDEETELDGRLAGDVEEAYHPIEETSAAKTEHPDDHGHHPDSVHGQEPAGVQASDEPEVFQLMTAAELFGYDDSDDEVSPPCRFECCDGIAPFGHARGSGTVSEASGSAQQVSDDANGSEDDESSHQEHQAITAPQAETPDHNSVDNNNNVDNNINNQEAPAPASPASISHVDMPPVNPSFSLLDRILSPAGPWVALSAEIVESMVHRHTRDTFARYAAGGVEGASILFNRYTLLRDGPPHMASDLSTALARNMPAALACLADMRYGEVFGVDPLGIEGFM